MVHHDTYVMYAKMHIAYQKENTTEEKGLLKHFRGYFILRILNILNGKLLSAFFPLLHLSVCFVVVGISAPLALQDELFSDPFSSLLRNQTALSHLNIHSPRLWPSNKYCSLSGIFHSQDFPIVPRFLLPSVTQPAIQLSPSFSLYTCECHTHTFLSLPPLCARRMWSQSLCTQRRFPCRPQRMQLLLF